MKRVRILLLASARLHHHRSHSGVRLAFSCSWQTIDWKTSKT